MMHARGNVKVSLVDCICMIWQRIVKLTPKTEEASQAEDGQAEDGLDDANKQSDTGTST